MSFLTDEPVSTWATKIAFSSRVRSARSTSSTAAGSTGRRSGAHSTSVFTPENAAISPQATAKRPDSSTRTLSPRDSVFEMAISQAPCPLEMVTNGRPDVRAMPGSAAKMPSESSRSSPS